MKKPCRFFALGHCAKGSSCPYSHEKDEKTQAFCEFYAAGTCTFGSKCALPHIKRTNLPVKKPTVKLFPLKYPMSEPGATFSQNIKNGNEISKFNDNWKSNNEVEPKKRAAEKNMELREYTEIHQLQCDDLSIENKLQPIECSVCLEIVADKKDKRYGLLECLHCACLECIREWRNHENMVGSKCCPICRTVTYFITPSLVWPESAEEKNSIISKYRLKLSGIDCRHYALGEGACPFGNSCFYRHSDHLGNLEATSIRHMLSGDGNADVMKLVRLSDFLN